LKRAANILVLRLGALGDIVHALPAVASLRLSFPDARIAWLAAARWFPLLQGNPAIDELIPFERDGLRALSGSWRRLRGVRPEIALDLQGLLQSAVAGRLSRPKRFLGFDAAVAREPLASMMYSERIRVTGPHRVERNLQLVAAAGAQNLTEEAFIPPGRLEGELPAGDFVLASPFAGWGSKQWPLAFYGQLADRLDQEGLELVLNVAPERAREAQSLARVRVLVSGLDGLIFATRRATAVVGVDSGPLHVAAALKKPGVALFGPTDPAQTGPFRSPMEVLRIADATTTYKRSDATHAAMSGLSAEAVWAALERSLAGTVKTA
jgi:heptosyltransferase I